MSAASPSATHAQLWNACPSCSNFIPEHCSNTSCSQVFYTQYVGRNFACCLDLDCSWLSVSSHHKGSSPVIGRDTPTSTVDIMCPESVNCQLNFKSMADMDWQCHDCWGLGCILVWLVTGELPFQMGAGMSQMARLRQMQAQHEAWVSAHSCCFVF